jgi:hypothetical protein
MDTDNACETPAPSLRELLAASGIESSSDRQRRVNRDRLQRMVAQMIEGEAPGIEVTYLEPDAVAWLQFT